MTDRMTATAVLICPIPGGTSVAELAAWMSRSQRSRVPVTWAVDLPMLTAAGETFKAAVSSTACELALDLSRSWPTSRQALRQSLRSARHSWPHIEAAILSGAARLDHRDVLVQEGITTVAVDHFDTLERGSRRPAPYGWSCRSILWGLWEVATTPATGSIIGRVTGLWKGGRRKGGLSVLDAGGSLDATVIRTRLDRHLAWVRRRSQAGLQAVTLSTVPLILRGGNDMASNGSVLRAA